MNHPAKFSTRGFSLILLLAIASAWLVLSAQAGAATYMGAKDLQAFAGPGPYGNPELRLVTTPEYTTESGHLLNTANGVAPNTSPDVAMYEHYPYANTAVFGTVAFNAYGSHHLWIYEWHNARAVGHETPMGMEPESTPSIATGGSQGGTYPYTVAFRGAYNHLWIYRSCEAGCTEVGTDSGQVVEAGTNASVSSDALVAFVGVSGTLEIYNDISGMTMNTQLPVEAHTSPAITRVGIGASSYTMVAFHHAGDSRLELYNAKAGVATPTNLGMSAGTDPSITQSSGPAQWRVAFDAASGHLWTFESTGVGIDTGNGLEPGTSPAIAERSGLGEGNHSSIAFKSAYNLWTFVPGWSQNTGFPVNAATKPTIAGEYTPR